MDRECAGQIGFHAKMLTCIGEGCSWVKIVSVQVGRAETRDRTVTAATSGGQWLSGYRKVPSDVGVWASIAGLSGDEQADQKNHGGAHRAVLAYGLAHYAAWERELGRALPAGAFAENITVDGLTEECVCIGDTFGCGDVVLQVTEPRIPCWKISEHWDVADFLPRVQATGRTGWFFRVLREGYLTPGAVVKLIDRPHPELTIALANRLLTGDLHDPALSAQFGACDLLPQGWRQRLSREVAG